MKACKCQRRDSIYNGSVWNHQGRGARAFNVLHDAVEDGDARANGKEQHDDQHSQGAQAQATLLAGGAVERPRLFGRGPAIAVAERDGDVALGGGLRAGGLVALGPVGIGGDGEAGAQQQHGGGV